MISQQTGVICASLMHTISHGERLIEIQRAKLCEYSLFHPMTSFIRIDRSHNNLLNPQDIQQFMDDNNYKIPIEYCAYIIQYYDTDFDGMLDYEDFTQLLLPEDKKLHTLYHTPIFSIQPNEFLPYDIEQSIASIINSEFEIHQMVEGLKQKLNNRYDFSVAMIFKILKNQNGKHLTHKNVAYFLQQNSFPSSAIEVKSLFKRIDYDKDGLLSIKDLQRALLPIQSDTHINPGYFYPTDAFLAQAGGKKCALHSKPL